MPVIDSLAQVADEVDLIVISQDKPDHCHRETLCSWPHHKPVTILATPAAARRIRDWKYFPASSIRELRAYDEADSTTLYRATLPHLDVGSLTFANLSSRKDLTGLHNAIGITFTPNGHNTRRDSSVVLDEPATPTPMQSTIVDDASSLQFHHRTHLDLRHSSQQRHETHGDSSLPRSAVDTGCLSCIYSPHGIASNLIEPYTHHHLLPSGALPLTVLIHGIVKERNPWYMGGTVATGTPGGIEIIKVLNGRVKAWVTAHDEQKDNRGLSVMLLKTEHYQEAEVKQLLRSMQFDSVDLHDPEPGQLVYLNG